MISIFVTSAESGMLLFSYVNHQSSDDMSVSALDFDPLQVSSSCFASFKLSTSQSILGFKEDYGENRTNLTEAGNSGGVQWICTVMLAQFSILNYN